MYANYIGKVVYSKSGRDKDRVFIILGIINNDYVYISDGDLRPVDKPKKKKIKHLIISDQVAEDIRNLILHDDKISNSIVKKFLGSMNSCKEV
jgi:ribosomal protein L14E/L6E/L27E